MKDPRVALTPAEYVRVEAQAAVEYPGECCGVVLARGDQPGDGLLLPCVYIQNSLHE